MSLLKGLRSPTEKYKNASLTLLTLAFSKFDLTVETFI